MTDADIDALPLDTNAQESLGRDIQRTSPKQKLSIFQAMDHVYRYVKQIEFDYNLAKRGADLRYKQSSRKRQYINDGRPPDTTQQLVKKNRVGRPKGSLNKIPKLADDLDLSTFGIPWSFIYRNFRATNTCALDTALMSNSCEIWWTCSSSQRGNPVKSACDD